MSTPSMAKPKVGPLGFPTSTNRGKGAARGLPAPRGLGAITEEKQFSSKKELDEVISLVPYI